MPTETIAAVPFHYGQLLLESISLKPLASVFTFQVRSVPEIGGELDCRFQLVISDNSSHTFL